MAIQSSRLSQFAGSPNSLAQLEPEELLQLNISSYYMGQEVKHKLAWVLVYYQSRPRTGSITRHVIVCSSCDIGKYCLTGPSNVKMISRIGSIDIAETHIVLMMHPTIITVSQSHEKSCSFEGRPFLAVMNRDFLRLASQKLSDIGYVGPLNRIRA